MRLDLTPDLLVELEKVKRLKYRYLRCLDQKDYDTLLGLFVPEATASYGGGAKELDGAEAIVGFIRDAMADPGVHSSHHCGQPEIDFLSHTEAVGTWSLVDMVIDTRYDITVQGASFYEDRYTRIDGHWRIAHTGYLRTYEEIFSRSSIEGLRLSASLWSTNGRSDLI